MGNNRITLFLGALLCCTEVTLQPDNLDYVEELKECEFKIQV